MIKNCSYCKKNKNIRFFRRYRKDCRKCEYQKRKEYFSDYSRKHPYKYFSDEKKEKLRIQRKAYYRKKHPIKIKKKDMIKLQEDKKKIKKVKKYKKIILFI